MIEARWFSTVRWLMLRSAAMFLLGWPVSTLSITSRCRGVRTPEVIRRRFAQLRQLSQILEQVESPLDACDEFLAANRFFDEVERARFHGLNRHRHVGIAGDHDRRQAMAVAVELLEQFEPAHSRQIGVDEQACRFTGIKGLQKGLAACIVIDNAAIVFEHGAYRLAKLVVIVDDDDPVCARIARRRELCEEEMRRVTRAPWPAVSRSRASTRPV